MNDEERRIFNELIHQHNLMSMHIQHINTAFVQINNSRVLRLLMWLRPIPLPPMKRFVVPHMYSDAIVPEVQPEILENGEMQMDTPPQFQKGA